MYTVHDESGHEVTARTLTRGVADAMAKSYYARNQCYVEVRNGKGERLYYWGVRRHAEEWMAEGPVDEGNK